MPHISKIPKSGPNQQCAKSEPYTPELRKAAFHHMHAVNGVFAKIMMPGFVRRQRLMIVA